MKQKDLKFDKLLFYHLAHFLA